MNIAQITNIKQHLDKTFGKNEGYWEYKSFDGEFICYTVRTRDAETGKKLVRPWTYKNNKLVPGGIAGKIERPIYNAQYLKQYPDKPILIVEGEKTAEAGMIFFPELITVTWLGGCQAVSKANWDFLKDKIVYLLPDNDKVGYEASEWIRDHIRDLAAEVRFIDIKLLNLSEHWDIADLLDEHGEIDVEVLLDFVRSTKAFRYPEIALIEKKQFPLLSKNGNPINAYENLEYICNHHKINVSFNIIRKEIVIDIPHKSFTVANKPKLDLAEITSLCIKNGMPRSDIIPWLTMIADKQSFNPVEQFILSKPWDGVSRIEELMNTIQCTDNKVRDIYMYRWMLGAIAVALSKNGLAHPGVLTFVSKQAAGKSSWTRKLVPKELNLVLGEFILNPDDKDSVIRATKYWIVELAEADATVNKSEASAQKSFLTRETDQYRCPYDRADTEAPRHTCFVGTVNDTQFLKDDTGNRRWWVLDVISINYKHTIDMQQVWAEFKIHLDKGEQFHLTENELELLMNQNEAYRPLSAIEEAIRLRYNWNIQEKNRKMTALQVLDDCGFDTKTNRNPQSKEANRVLRLLCADKSKKIDGLFYFYLPPQRAY